MAAQKSIQPKSKSRLGWVLLAWVIAAFIFLSVQPVMSLHSSPPLEFLQPDSDWGAERRAMEDKAARIYWRLAVEVIQHRHPFGTQLPERPLAEFELNQKEFPAWKARDFDSSRTHHWQHLRSLWGSPQVWNRTYVWDPARIGKRFVELFTPVRRVADQIVSRFLQ